MIANSPSASAQGGSVQEKFPTYRSVPTHPQSGGQAESLIALQPVLDCELAPAPNTVDANLWARLKLKYELYCYKQVEILIHRRLRQLAAVERLPTVDGTSNNSRGRNLSTLKLLATIIDAPAASRGVVAGEEDAAPGPSIVAPTATTNIAETIPSDGSGSSPSKDAKFYLERGIASYRDGDLPVAIADFDLAIEGDPNLKDAYIDQGIAWYRMSNFHRAFDVIAQAARIKFAPSLRLHRSRRRRSVK